MKDQRKTKAQLIDELAQLRQRVAEVEAADGDRRRASDSDRARERVLALSRTAAKVQGVLEPDRVFETIGEELRNLGLNCWFGLVDDKGERITLRHINLSGKVLDAYNELGSAMAKLAVEVPPEALGGLDGEAPVQLPLEALADMETVGVTLDKEGRSLAFALRMCFASSDAAEDMETVINAYMLFAEGQQYVPEEAQEMLEGVDIGLDGSCLDISIEVSVPDIEELITTYQYS